MGLNIQMHNQTADINKQIIETKNKQILQNNLVNSFDMSGFCTPTQDCFVKKSGIIPPRNWKPDEFAGLGPELTPQEKLKKKYEDLRKPMYLSTGDDFNKNNNEACSTDYEEPEPKKNITSNQKSKKIQALDEESKDFEKINNQTSTEFTESEKNQPKTFKQKLKDVGAKIKNYFKNLFS